MYKFLDRLKSLISIIVFPMLGLILSGTSLFTVTPRRKMTTMLNGYDAQTRSKYHCSIWIFTCQPTALTSSLGATAEKGGTGEVYIESLL